VKLGAAIPVLNEWRFLPAVVHQMLKVVDRCVILRGTRSFSGDPVQLGPVPQLDKRVELVSGAWSGDNETRNAGMRILRDCRYVFLVDSDEIILDRELFQLRDVCRTDEPRLIGLQQHVYWKTPEYQVDPPPQGAVRMIWRNDLPVTGLRGGPANLFEVDARYHHLSHARTDREMVDKIRLTAHRDEIPCDWIDRVWRAWDRNRTMEDLHPTSPSFFKRVVHRPNSEILSLLDETGCDWSDLKKAVA